MNNMCLRLKPSCFIGGYMWNVFKKLWVKGKGVKAVLSDACNIGYADGGDVTNGERTLSPQHFPWRSSLRMRGSRQHEFRFLGTLTYRENDQAGHDERRCVTDSDIPSRNYTRISLIFNKKFGSEIITFLTSYLYTHSIANPFLKSLFHYMILPHETRLWDSIFKRFLN